MQKSAKTLHATDPHVETVRDRYGAEDSRHDAILSAAAVQAINGWPMQPSIIASSFALLPAQ
ncbi:MAG: hypothetical protein AAFV43_09200 [Planctomycetota bacterium]